MSDTEDYIAEELYRLSKRLCERNPDKQAHGVLGGEFGYGQDFENEVFKMFPYYWEDCNVCDDEKYVNMIIENLPKHDCPHERPNFLHKASGLEVRWYKYIGRSMEINKSLPRKELRDIFAECASSLGG